jgi:hypothetical protein
MELVFKKVGFFMEFILTRLWDRLNIQKTEL